MQILMDTLVTQQRPDVVEALTSHSPECSLATFEFLNAAVSINEAVEIANPDVIVVDAVWLHLAALLAQLLEEHSATNARVVIATECADQIFFAQVAHRGYTDCIDLSLSSNDIVLQLCQAASQSPNRAAHPTADLWPTVPQPPTVHRYDETPRDEVDQEILRLLSVGMQDIDISHIIHASPQTVKNRISAMLDRSGLRNRTQLAWLHHNHEVADAVRRSISYGRNDTVDHIAS